VLVWYRVGKTEGNGKGSVVMCAGLVHVGGDGVTCKGFCGNVL
jgi:hypothetical protein